MIGKILNELLKENSLVLKHGAYRMLNVIYPHLGSAAVEGFRILRVVFRQYMNGPWYAAGMSP